MKDCLARVNKALSILLCISMLISLLPLNVFATDIDIISDQTSILEPGTYTFNESGELICDECGEAGSHSSDCGSFSGNNDDELFIATDSDAVIDDYTGCNCGDIHNEDCEYYEAPIIDDNQSCNCDSIYDVHDDTCPLYVVTENNKDIPIINECNCENGVHTKDCILYEHADV